MNEKKEKVEEKVARQPIPKVRLFFDNIICTTNKRVLKGGLITTEGDIFTRQTVLVVGPNAMVNVGDEIEINVDRFPRKNVGAKQVGAVKDIGGDNYVIVPPIEIINNIPYLYLSSREIKYVYEK